MRSRSLLVVIVILTAAALVAGYVLTHRKADNSIRGSGTIEATDVDLSFQIPGRVIEVLAVEGQAVKAGDVVARLSPDELAHKVSQIQAALEAATSQVRQQERVVALRRDVVEGQVEQARGEAQASRVAADRVREGLRPQEIRVAEAELAQAEAQLAQSRAEFDRISSLVKEGVVPRQQLDNVEAALRTAEAAREATVQRLAIAREGSRRQDIAEAEARAETAQAGVNVAQAGRTDVDVQRAALSAARAREKELLAQLEAAKTQLSYTEIRAPLDGVVLTRNVEAGEFVNPGTPVVTIANIDDLWMNIYVPETQTGLVKLGQEVRVTVDSFPGESFKGKIAFVSSESEFTPKTILTQEERIKLVYRTKVSLENTQQRLKPGMPADAEIVVP
ncbi:MAG TPA: efflux RND transporter periplasmic adaptor subunit [Terriglobia bacterium]|nr:efflux RND transporter periplasmic adaptor subunit [Terriglobia bacterium]